MKHTHFSTVQLSILHALGKGFSVFYFILLSVLYARGMISDIQIGSIGTLFIVLVIVGAALVARWLHRHQTRTILIFSAWTSLLASSVLLLSVRYESALTLFVAYSLMGLSVGIAMSGANAVAAIVTKKGKRYHTLAKLGMLTDVVRIVMPVAVASALVIGSLESVIGVAILISLIFLSITRRLPRLEDTRQRQPLSSKTPLRYNRRFQFILSLEFLDSFSSSQLFVFLPLLFLAKGYTIENSLLLQTAIFLGYLSGRWLIGQLASRRSGASAIATAELGMVMSIVLLLVVDTAYVLYFLSYLLGIFARGTSPAIKALSFDSLSEAQIKRGSALHVVAGDSGSMIGQLTFGLLFAWLGVEAPFLLAAGVSTFIALLLVGNLRTTRN